MISVRTHAVAGAAYERVCARRNDPKKNEYGALAHKLPGMILQNGLAQATGFLVAKNEPEHLSLLNDLNAVLRESGSVSTADGFALHRLVIQGDLTETMHLTRRSLEACGWIKRYVQGLMKLDATGENAADDGDTRVGDHT